MKADVLELEFNYAKETSIQSHSDRLSLLNFYLALYAGIVTISSGLTAIPGLQLPLGTLSLLFLSLAFISVVFVLQMVRLRQAWLESVAVMNRIKQHFIDLDPKLNKVLLWQTKTTPKATRFNSISHFSALLVTTLGDVALAVSLLTVGWDKTLIAVTCISYLLVLQAMYFLLLKYNK